MDNCPSEIWDKIFSFACRDDGFTGRSLALVSKYMRDVSSPTRYQSLKVEGLDQMLDCARVLESTPAANRRVRYLFLSTAHPDEEPKPSEQNTLDLIKYEAQIHQAMVQLLSLMLPAMTLPALSELTLYGPFPDDETNQLIFAPYPSLRRLHLANIPYYPSDQRIPSIAPSLTHLRVSARESDFLDFIRRLARVIDLQDHIDNTDGIIDGNQQLKLPDTLQRILFEPSLEQPSFGGGWFMSSYQYLLTMKEIWQVARIDDRLVVIDTRNLSRSRWSFHEAEADWIERINGGQGCWRF
ncbi:F-box domain-containing protein [Pleurotus pulmonarius]